MKKKVLIAILVALILGGVTVLGFASVTYIQNKALESESSTLLVTAQESSARKMENSDEVVAARVKGSKSGTDLRQLMRSKGYYEDEIAMAVAKVVDISVFYDMTQEEYDYILSLVKLGYDPEKLVAIYQFLQLTPDGISIMRQIYDIGIRFSGEQFWIENAYEMVKGAGGQTLSLQEIDAYVKAGISADEIMLCYQMSLNGTKEIRQILEARISGSTWPQICEAVYGTDEVVASDFDKDLDLRSLQTLILMAGKTGNKTKNIIEKNGKGETQVKQQVLTQYDSRSNRVKALQQELDADPRDTDKFKQVIKEKAKGISDKAAEKLSEKGYRVREVKEAISTEKEDETLNQIRGIIEDADGEVAQQ